MAGIDTYPFDPTGRAIGNKIVGEPQIITAENSRDYHFIVPKFAPYFMDSLRIIYKDTTGVQKILVKGVDWYESHEFISASRACANPVFGSISFLNTDLAGVVYIDYQTIGGEWIQNSQEISRILADRIHNPRIVAWEQVTNLPREFPPIDHEWDLVDMVGMAEVQEALKTIEAALRYKSGEDFNIHLTNYGNPHAVTKEQVGLGLVNNYPMATNTTALDTSNSTEYLSPHTAASLIKQQVGDGLTAHVGSYDNPHNVTATQVGAYSTTQIDNMLNGKLGKYEAASDSARLNGLTPAQFSAQVLQGTSANSKLLDGRTYMQLLADIQGGQGGDSSLFNGMTPDQFKAYVLDDGTAYNSSRLEGRSWVELLQYVNEMTAFNSDRFAGMTETEFKDSLSLLTVTNSERLGGQTPEEFKIQVLQGTVRNTGLFNEKTEAEFIEEVLQGTAADATMFGGRTVNEWFSDMREIVDDANAQMTAFVNQIEANLRASIVINSQAITALNESVTQLQNQVGTGGSGTVIDYGTLE